MREHARAIFQAAVDAARPEPVVSQAIIDTALGQELRQARRIVVVGAGKAGPGMVQGLIRALGDCLDRVVGLVNVPDTGDLPQTLGGVVLHPARPVGSNHPTAEGVAGAERMLELLTDAGPEDVAVCLLSGGGSALLPAPVEGVSLEDKQAVTRLLHASGATINEMNAVRKHLSRIKGGRLAQAFRGRALYSLILSDVIGDPLDVIASGPTAPDPSTFSDALAVLERHGLTEQTPAAVLRHLRAGVRDESAETPKELSANVHNLLLANNSLALRAAAARAETLGYRVLNLGSFIEGETRHVAVALAGVVRSIQAEGLPLRPPVCILCVGETTVTLTPGHGKGGRNQEFVLAAALHLGPAGLRDVVVLSGGTDGEDGPTDAAGAVADAETMSRGLHAQDYLDRHDAWSFFRATNDLLLTGLTGTNVMDVRLFLIGGAP